MRIDSLTELIEGSIKTCSDALREMSNGVSSTSGVDLSSLPQDQ